MIYGDGGVWCPILYVFSYLCENKKGGSVGHHTSFALYMCVDVMVMPDPTILTFSITCILCYLLRLVYIKL